MRSASRHVALAVVLASMGFLPTASALSFSGTVRPTAPLVSDGTLEVAASGPFSFALDVNHTMARAESASLIVPRMELAIKETRWQSSRPPALPSPLGSSNDPTPVSAEDAEYVASTITTGRTETERHVVNVFDASVFFDSFSPGHTVAGFISPHDNRSQVRLKVLPSSCQIAPPSLSERIETAKDGVRKAADAIEAAKEQKSADPIQDGFRAADVAAAAAMLTADCASSEVVVPALANPQFRVLGPVVRVRWLNTDLGRQQELSFPTGLSAQENRTLSRPGSTMYDYTLKTVFLDAAGGARPLQMPAASGTHVRFQSPAISLAGTIHLLPGAGTVAWGNLVQTNSTTALAPSGTFLLRPEGQDGIRIEGETLNVPTSATSTTPTFRDAAVSLSMAAAVVGAAGLVVLVVRRGLPLLLGLFSRVSRESVLDHARRSAILELVTADPGVSLPEVGQTLGLSRGVLNHHVSFLRREKVIVARRFGTKMHLFSRGAIDESDLEAVARLRDEFAQALLRLVQEDPGQAQAKLAQRLGTSQSHVSKTLRMFARLGVLEPERRGRRVTYRGGKAADPAAG